MTGRAPARGMDHHAALANLHRASSHRRRTAPHRVIDDFQLGVRVGGQWGSSGVAWRMPWTKTSGGRAACCSETSPREKLCAMP